jgi:H+/Cl- antiporter ClcA
MFTYIKSILFVILILCVIGYICKTYEKINDNLSDAESNSDMNPKIFYFITPIFFWLASRTFLFKNANGPLMLHVKSLFYNLDKPDFFKDVVPFTSLIALATSSLLTVYAGGALGYETVVVSMSMILLLSASDFFKNIIQQINVEKLLYMGYIFGFTFAFKTPISSFVLAIEKSIVGHSHNTLTNVLYSCIAIGVAMIFTDDDKIVPSATPQTYELEIISILKYSVLAVICGIFSSIFFKITYSMYHEVKKLVLNSTVMSNIIPLLLGLCVAIVINTTGYVSTQNGTQHINNMFGKHYVYSYENIIGHIINIFLTFISGCSGGLIIPSISIGSYIGFLYNKITDIPLLQTLIIGMTSIFSAFFGYPISASFIVQNILNQNVEILPLLIGMSYISFYSSKYFNRFVFQE